VGNEGARRSYLRTREVPIVADILEFQRVSPLRANQSTDRRWLTKLRAFRLRTIGPPLAVAALSVAALAWFDRVWIPTQQQYLNERNLRALRTISAQIKAKVDNFDQAIDHAIDSFPIQDRNNKLLQKYVKLFSPELEIVTFDMARAATKVTPGEPPSVRIQRDEGRNYLYINYEHEAEHRGIRSPISLMARADIEQLVTSSLTRSDFDALLLVDGQGATIAQQSGSGLELTRVDKVRDRGQSAAAGTVPDVFNRMRGTTNLAPVTIGAADYMLYAQPVQLSLLHEGKETTQGPELWTLCGLVRLDRFRATSATIPTTYWLFFGVVLVFICFAIPLVKLRVLSPRERLRRVDGVSVAAATFMMMALATFAAADLHLFGAVVPAAVDAQLQAVAASISAHVHQEVAAIDKQMKAFEHPGMWQDTLGYSLEDRRNVTEIRTSLEPGEGAAINLNAEAGRRQCVPAWSCRSGILSTLAARDPDALDSIDYPFFKMIVWSDDAGWQRVKWSTSSVVTPFINVDEAPLGYAGSLKLARRLSGDTTIPTSGVSVVMSPNTGEKLAAFWKALPVLAGRRENRPDLLGAILSTTPVSLTNPVLPKNVQFAVLDRTGRVMFHSDAARSLTENFFQESEDSPTLKSLVATRDRGAVSGRYQGRAHRFHVTPLDLAPFGDPRWSLVVFQEKAVSETANIETITLAAAMFGLYAIGLAAIWGVFGALWPRAVGKWLWPAPEKGPHYRRAAAVGTAAGVLCVLALAGLKPIALLSVAAMLIVAALAAIFVIVRADHDHPAASSSLADFFWVRASLLFLLAAVPALICFQIGYAFNAELVTKRAESHLASELGARSRRVNAQAQKVAICSEGDPGSQTCPAVGAMVTRRTMDTLWDVHVPVTREQSGPIAGDNLFGATALRSFLMYAYRPYNEIAADVLLRPAAPPGRGLERWRLAGDGDAFTEDPRAVTTRWKFAPAMARQVSDGAALWLMAALLMGVAWVLVRYLLRPLFALDLNPSTSLAALASADDDTSLLVVGPARSRRTARLRLHPRVRIFDVRSLTFTDEPILATASSPAQASAAADDGHANDHQDLRWAESVHAATKHPFTIVAVDHFDHRLHDQAFRHRLLECLEAAIYGRGAAIWWSSPRHPIVLLEELEPAAPDRHRWLRLFEGFRREHLGLEVDQQRKKALEQLLMNDGVALPPALQSLIVAECAVAPELLAIGERLAGHMPFGIAVNNEMILAEIGRAAESFYSALWNSCSTDDRVVLRQLAEEGLVNPNNRAAARMLSAGLVRRDPAFRLMNETFRRFVIGAASPQVVSEWEHEGVRVPWGTIATTGVTVAFGLAGLLLLTQEQLVDAWISYVPAFAPAIPTVWKVLASAQKGRLDVPA
jgi:hypothetical protein